MNKLETVKESLLNNIPDINYDYDPAETETGSSWLDLRLEDQLINIEWRPNKGFGLYFDDEESYGSGPKEVYRNTESLIRRVLMIFVQHKIHLRLKEIREILGVSQMGLGEILGQKQGSISKLESRERDVRFNTLCSVINALGGTLEIKAHFKDFDVPLDFSCSNKSNNKTA